MAMMIDSRPEYQGEAKVWDSIKSSLADNVIAYNHREINGREFDFCLLVEEFGILVIEVKGWIPEKIKVQGVDEILVEGYESSQRSPKKQARAYRFALLNQIQERHSVSPLVIDMVCYPFISRAEYLTARLDVVSESNFTIFKEDLEDAGLMRKKIAAAFSSYSYIPHEELTKTLIAELRQDWEPAGNEVGLPGETAVIKPYSILSYFSNDLTDDEATGLVNDYMAGVKQTIFLGSKRSFDLLLDAFNAAFQHKNIQPNLTGLSIGYKYPLRSVENRARTFNLEMYEVEDVNNQQIASFSIEEGQCSEVERNWVELLASKTTFNYQQYLVEHASTDNNVLVEAGAGTGKTYSMVSRIAFLCNKRDRPVSCLSDEVALMTFTNDAATNMKVRLKQVFINYFILTGKPKHLKMVDEVDQANISTIHSFAIGLLRHEVLYSGLGTNFRISSNELQRSSIYDDYLSAFCDEMGSMNPNFLNEIPVPIYDLKKRLITVADRLLAKSVSLASINSSEMGVPVRNYIPYFNDLIEKVVIPAENAYSNELHRNNCLDLKEAIVQLAHVLCRHSGLIRGLKFRFLFIDEFQDTDDVQIQAFAMLQRLIDAECRFFIVGDLKQSIYRFRGATISAFATMRDKSKYGWDSYALTINYRTDHRLLDRYHPVFSMMGHAGMLPYVDGADKLVSTVTKESEEEDLFTCIPCNCKDDRIFAEQFTKVLKRQIELLESIIQKRTDGGDSPLGSAERTIAILVRSNWQVEKLVRAGRNAGIVIDTKTGGDLFQLESTIDMYKLVEALCDCSNPVRLVNLIESNFVGLSLNYQEYRDVAYDRVLADLVRILDEFFAARIGKSWQEVVNNAYSQPILYVIKNLYDALQPWKQYSNRRRDQELYIINYEYLVERMLETMRVDSLTLNQIAEYLRVNIVTQQEQASRHLAEEDDNGIHIICTTVHKSKGLEYGSVILPFTYEDISRPDRIRTDASYVDNKLSYIVTFDSDSIEYNSNFTMGVEVNEQTQEEARILYVAMTRAIRSCVWMKDLDSHPKVSWGTLLEA